jgi:hypothetical protein
MTSLDSVGFDIFNGIGGYNGVTSSKSIALSAVAHHPSDIATFLPALSLLWQLGCLGDILIDRICSSFD